MSWQQDFLAGQADAPSRGERSPGPSSSTAGCGSVGPTAPHEGMKPNLCLAAGPLPPPQGHHSRDLPQDYSALPLA